MSWSLGCLHCPTSHIALRCVTPERVSDADWMSKVKYRWIQEMEMEMEMEMETESNLKILG